jgi:hypothetical protein
MGAKYRRRGRDPVLWWDAEDGGKDQFSDLVGWTRGSRYLEPPTGAAAMLNDADTPPFLAYLRRHTLTMAELSAWDVEAAVAPLKAADEAAGHEWLWTMEAYDVGYFHLLYVLTGKWFR